MARTHELEQGAQGCTHAELDVEGDVDGEGDGRADGDPDVDMEPGNKHKKKAGENSPLHRGIGRGWLAGQQKQRWRRFLWQTHRSRMGMVMGLGLRNGNTIMVKGTLDGQKGKNSPEKFSNATYKEMSAP